MLSIKVGGGQVGTALLTPMAVHWYPHMCTHMNTHDELTYAQTHPYKDGIKDGIETGWSVAALLG